ncbi:hypothetical protein ACS0TY_028827 [Phlomoides rotata]
MLLKGMEFDTTHFITDVSGKYPRLWALKGAHSVTVNRWYKFGALASIRTIAPSFQEISELPEWCEDGPSTRKLETNNSTDRRKIWSYAEERKSSRAPSKKNWHKPPTALISPAGSHDLRREPSLLPYIKSSKRRGKIIEIGRIKNQRSEQFLLLPPYSRKRIKAVLGIAEGIQDYGIKL